MIIEPTVFVLGAGASQPYGFPVGRTLADEVCGHLSGTDPSTEFRYALGQCGIRNDVAEQMAFYVSMRESGCATLDEFVQAEGNRKYLPLVKASIIARLVACEEPRLLFPDLPEYKEPLAMASDPCDWYAYLFDRMRTAEAEQFRSNQLKVITFNFDRSFEYRLFLMLRGSYGLSDLDATKLCTSVPVLHVHGSLGGPAWLGERRPESRTYEPSATREQRRELMDRIRIVHEEIDQRVLETAHEWIVSAQRIAFIGFGYHRINIQRLNMHVPHPSAVIWGTTLGFSGIESETIERRFGNRGQTRLRLNCPFDALTFLREVDVLVTD